MTEQDWKSVEKQCTHHLFSCALLEIDGYSITLRLERVAKFQLGIAVIVDEKIKMKWILEDCEIRRRFYRESKHHLYPRKFREAPLFKNDPEFHKKVSQYHFYWQSFAKLKAHLIKNNKSIKLLWD